jgi:hypothetical protein
MGGSRGSRGERRDQTVASASQEASLVAEVRFTQMTEDSTSRPYFEGLLRDVRVYDRPLTAEEVRTLWAEAEASYGLPAEAKVKRPGRP